MEFEDRNPLPEEPSKTVPSLVLFVLIGIVCLLLYAGYYLMSDDASKVSDLDKENTPALPIQDSLIVDPADTKTAEVEVEKATEPEVVKEEIKEPETEKVIEKVVEKPAPVVVEKPKEKVAAIVEKPKEKVTEIVQEKSSDFTTVTVKDGQTFLGIANRYNVSFSELKAANQNVDPNGLKVGSTKIKVPVQAVHTVGAGDILRVVAKKYGITVEQLMAANGKTKNFAERGEKLIIPKKK